MFTTVSYPTAVRKGKALEEQLKQTKFEAQSREQELQQGMDDTQAQLTQLQADLRTLRQEGEQHRQEITHLR